MGVPQNSTPNFGKLPSEVRSVYGLVGRPGAGPQACSNGKKLAALHPGFERLLVHRAAIQNEEEAEPTKA